MPSRDPPPPKDDDPKAKSQPLMFEVSKNDAKPEKNTAVIVGVLIVVVGIVLYAYFR